MSETADMIEAIAIIGMAGRFPGASNITEFWENLQGGKESIHFFSDAELAAAGVDAEVLHNPRYVKARGILEDIDAFDAAFFDIPPRQAEIMDPQHRLFLECAWAALEQAGYISERYAGRIGVYAGTGMNRYLLTHLFHNRHLFETLDHFQAMLGNDKDFLPTRVSYKLNLRGASVGIQTACSSSLVAVSLACQSLLTYQNDIALAGGVAIHLPQMEGYLYQEGGTHSADGHCRAFDAQAQGMVDGSGVGIVVLKRLSEALLDRDHIYAVIKGSAVNNDGAMKVGYTAPSIDGQTEVILLAQAIAAIDPSSISYIEAQGTGTLLGDPMEVAALKQVFQGSMCKKNACALGSVKTNIGHLDTAAGVASLIKTALALYNKKLPPSLHFVQPNPHIDFANSPLYVVSALQDWDTDQLPRRAGISSFGIGGTNAHLILEEAPTLEILPSSQSWQLLVLSAKTPQALAQTARQLASYLKDHPEVSLAHVAYTLQVGRRTFGIRCSFVCRDIPESIHVLENYSDGPVLKNQQPRQNTPVSFLFPGEDKQCFAMGQELYAKENVFREYIDHCAKLFHNMLGIDVRSVLCQKASDADQDLLDQPLWARAALFTLEYALAQLWISWGISPHSMLGSAVGEYVAACIAEVFSLEDAAILLAAQGKMTQHVQAIPFRPPEIPFVSHVTGTWITDEQAVDPSYWTQHVHQAGRFADAVQVLLSNSEGMLLEVGPGESFSDLVKNHPAKTSQHMLCHSLPPQPSPHSVRAFLLTTLGLLWTEGVAVQWSNFSRGEQCQRIPLPTYPFERQRYWLAQSPPPGLKNAMHSSHAQAPVESQTHSPASSENAPGTIPIQSGQLATPEGETQLPPTATMERDASSSTAPLTLSSDEIEQTVVAVWQQHLGIPSIGVHDDFFDLHGDSLLAIQIVSQLCQIFYISLPLQQFLEAPTIAHLTQSILDAQSTQTDDEERVDPSGQVEISSRKEQ